MMEFEIIHNLTIGTGQSTCRKAIVVELDRTGTLTGHTGMSVTSHKMKANESAIFKFHKMAQNT